MRIKIYALPQVINPQFTWNLTTKQDFRLVQQFNNSDYDHRAGTRLIRKSIEEINIGDYERGEIQISLNVIEHVQNVR
jgi:hypothetical protein